MIDPGTKREGEEFEAYCKRRWGSSGWTRNLRIKGQKDGANFANWKWWPNTLKAHQMILFGKNRHQVDTSRSKAALFEALYEEGENISLTDTLVKVGSEKLDLPMNELRPFLDRDEGAGEVQKEIEDGRKSYRIESVPFFIIGGDAVDKPYGMSGAQDSNTFLEIFAEVSGQD